MEVVLGSFLEDECDNEYNYDRTALPATGMEYLRMVQREAANCQEVKVAKLDESKLKFGEKIVGITKASSIQTIPHEFLPSYEWQTIQTARFAFLRQDINRFKSDVQGMRSLEKHSVALPKKNNPENWCLFCLGEEACHKMNISNISTSDSTAEDYTNAQGHKPLLKTVLKLTQKRVIMLLQYHLGWIQQIGFSNHQGRWIYSLLACLEKPLLAEIASLLRSLARSCAKCREKQVADSNESDILGGLNLIITLVGRYFDQKDLIEEIP